VVHRNHTALGSKRTDADWDEDSTLLSDPSVLMLIGTKIPKAHGISPFRSFMSGRGILPEIARDNQWSLERCVDPPWLRQTAVSSKLSFKTNEASHGRRRAKLTS